MSQIQVKMVLLNEKWTIIKRKRIEKYLAQQREYVTEKEVFCQTNQFFCFECHDFAS